MVYLFFVSLIILVCVIYYYRYYRGELIYKFEVIDIMFCDKVKYLFNEKSYKTYRFNSIGVICIVILLALKYMSNDIILQIYFSLLLSVALLRLVRVLRIKNKLHIFYDKLQYSNVTIDFLDIENIVINNRNIEIRIKNCKTYIFKFVYESDIDKVRVILNTKLCLKTS